MYESCPACASQDVYVQMVGVQRVVAGAAAQGRRSEGARLLGAKGFREGGAHFRGSVPPPVAIFEKEPRVGVHRADLCLASRTRLKAGGYIPCLWCQNGDFVPQCFDFGVRDAGVGHV